MDDIVERMKDWLAAQPDPRGRTFHPLHPETLIAQGATEIERLREVVRFYACECSDAEACETFGDHDRSACGYKARAALGEEM